MTFHSRRALGLLPFLGDVVCIGIDMDDWPLLMSRRQVSWANRTTHPPQSVPYRRHNTIYIRQMAGRIPKVPASTSSSNSKSRYT